MEVQGKSSYRVWWLEIDPEGEGLLTFTEIFSTAEERDAFLLDKVNRGEIYDILGSAESSWTEPGPVYDPEVEAVLRGER